MVRGVSVSAPCPPGKKASGSEYSTEGGSGRGQAGAAAAAEPEVTCSESPFPASAARVGAQLPAVSVGPWRERCSEATPPSPKSRRVRSLCPPQIEPRRCPAQFCHPPGWTLPSVQELS